MKTRYTGHVPCRKCGQTHWMYGDCPPQKETPPESDKPKGRDWCGVLRILLALSFLIPMLVLSYVLERLMEGMDVVNDWLIDKGMKFADWTKRNNV